MVLSGRVVAPPDQSYASIEAWLPAAPPDHSGWLWKEGHVHKG